MALNAKRGTKAPRQCLSWVNRVAFTVRRSLPVYPEKQTFSESVGMSQRCQRRTSALASARKPLQPLLLFSVHCS